MSETITLPPFDLTPAAIKAWLDTKEDGTVVALCDSTTDCLVARYIREQLEAVGLTDVRVGCGHQTYSVNVHGDHTGYLNGDMVLLTRVVKEFDDLFSQPKADGERKAEVTAGELRAAMTTLRV